MEGQGRGIREGRGPTSKARGGDRKGGGLAPKPINQNLPMLALSEV